MSLLRCLWPGCTIFISGILPRYVISKFFHSRRLDLNKRLIDFSYHSKDTLFVPQFLTAAQIQNDGIHPTLEGVSFLTRRLVATLEGKKPPPIPRPPPLSASSSSSGSRMKYPSQRFLSYKDALISPSASGTPDVFSGMKTTPRVNTGSRSSHTQVPPYNFPLASSRDFLLKKRPPPDYLAAVSTRRTVVPYSETHYVLETLV